ncbi:MAG TPA: DEAD/DEAH box helicase, partial [Acidimicrobiales bacterium]|nr:DEAD/DEAH box helicase [Acidimicrobiales bacterium]
MPSGPAARQEVVDLLEALSDRGQLARVVSRPPRPAVGGTPASLPDPVAALVPQGGLWSHQARALDLARAGRSLVVATSTASGKSLCYQLAIAAAAHEDRRATALVLVPTKALARDQLRSWTGLVPDLDVAVYDGDTPADERSLARRQARVLVTNPEMLHVGILPNHERWARLLSGLRYVVVDEAHILRGVFGSHVSHVLRRLRRLADGYGSAPTFWFTSATIGEPAALASTLAGVPVEEVTGDGSPQGERLLALWNPPLLDRHRGRRASPHEETAELLAGLTAAGLRTIAFTRSRAATERVADAARRRLPPGLADLVRPYRGGYLPGERRAIEAALAGGQLRGLAATSALELGIDVGGLDACVLDGFPGTVSSLWQRAGRAGRRAGLSLTVLVAGPDALDQWWMAHPDQLLARAPEPSVVTPANPSVLHPQLACAAWETPLSEKDDTWWGPPALPDGAFEEAVTTLAREERLVVREGRAVHAGRRAPAPGVNLRVSSPAPWWIALAGTEGQVIGTAEDARVFATLHPGAVYLHQGQRYRVEALDDDDRVAWVAPTDDDEVTQARIDVDVAVLAEDRTCELGRSRLALGPVEVVERVVGYERREADGGRRLGEVALDLPPSRLVTRGLWYRLEEELVAGALGHRAGRRRVVGSLHALEHAAIGILPLFAI